MSQAGPRRSAPHSVPPFEPARWARGPHSQTLIAHFWPSRGADLARSVDAQRWEIELDDGDRLVTFHRPALDSARNDRPPVAVYLFHGLSGDTSSDYMRRSARVLYAAGCDVIATNHRGCGAGRGLARHPYHSGRGEDVAAVVSEGRRRLPDHRHVAIGFSLSGNCLLLLLSGGTPRTRAVRDGSGLPDAALAFNPPADLARCSERIGTGRNRLYEWRFVRRLKRVLRQRVEDGLIEAGTYDLSGRIGLRELDERYTGPAGGFGDAQGYYASCSTHRRLERIEVPTIIVSARDDPFVEAEILERAPRSDAVDLRIEVGGGHLGYLQRSIDSQAGRRWLDCVLPALVGEVAPPASDRMLAPIRS